MANDEIGSAYVSIRANTNKLPKDIDKALSSPAVTKVAASSGSSMGDPMGGGLAASLKKFVVGGTLLKVGKEVGGALMEGMTEAVNQYSRFEQLEGGIQKIFDEADISGIMQDAANAYQDLNMSANDYMEAISQVGATFAQTMGDQAGYDTARTGMKAIADYASGTGRNLDELNEKYALITRSTSSYQSIADQFSGILPATSADFLEQAQAAGFLGEQYESLTEVPIAEYQQAVTGMLEQGVDSMGLLGNTAAESYGTISGSAAMMQSSWENLVTDLGKGNVDMTDSVHKFTESLGAYIGNLAERIPIIISSVITGLPTLFSDVTTRLVTWVSEAIDTYGPQVATWFEELPGNVGIWIGGAIQSVFDAGNSIIGKLLGGAETGEEHGTLVTFFTDLPTNIQTWLGNTAETLQQKGREFIAGLLFGTTEVSDADFKAKIEGLPGEIMAWIGNTAETLQQAGRDLIAGLLFGTTEVSDEELKAKIEGLPGETITWLGSIAETLQQSGRDLIAGLLFGTTEVSDGELMTAMTELPGKLLGFIGDTISTLFNTGVDFLTGFYVGFSEILNGSLKTDMSGFLNTVGGFIGSAISSLWQVGVDFITGFFTGASDEKDKDGESTFGNILELAKAWMQAGIDVASFLLDMGVSLITGFLNGVSGGKWTEIQQWFEDLPDNVAGFIKNAPSALLEKGKEIMRGMLDGIKNVFGIDLSQPDSISKFVQSIPGKIVEFIGDLGQTLLDTGKGLITGFFTGIKDIFGGTGIEGDTVTKFIQDAPQAIVDAIGDLSQTLWQAGADLMNGLGAGIQAFIQDPIGTIAQLGEDVAKQFMETTDENSPSKVFEQLGGYLMEGLDNGINDESGTPTASIESVAGELPNGFVDAYWSMHDQGAALMQSFGTGLSNAFYGGYGTGSVANTLSTISGSVSSYVTAGYYTLWDNGQYVMAGFGDSMVSYFNRVVTSQLQSITNAIPSWKGPESKDKHLLTSTGEIIMQSLADGIETGAQKVHDALYDLTNMIPQDVAVESRIDSRITSDVARQAQPAGVTITGNTFNVRDDRDIERIAEELNTYITRQGAFAA